jgi:hypothetical protein
VLPAHACLYLESRWIPPHDGSPILGRMVQTATPRDSAKRVRKQCDDVPLKRSKRLYPWAAAYALFNEMNIVKVKLNALTAHGRTIRQEVDRFIQGYNRDGPHRKIAEYCETDARTDHPLSSAVRPAWADIPEGSCREVRAGTSYRRPRRASLHSATRSSRGVIQTGCRPSTLVTG